MKTRRNKEPRLVLWAVPADLFPGTLRVRLAEVGEASRGGSVVRSVKLWRDAPRRRWASMDVRSRLIALPPQFAEQLTHEWFHAPLPVPGVDAPLLPGGNFRLRWDWTAVSSPDLYRQIALTLETPV